MAAAAGEEKELEEILKGLDSYIKDFEDLKRLAPAFIADYRKKVEQFKADGTLGSLEHQELENRKSRLILCANKMNEDLEATTAFVAREVERLEQEDRDFQDELLLEQLQAPQND